MIIAITLAALLSGQAAPAAPPIARVERDARPARAGGPDGRPSGAPRLDRDGDGFISRDEYVGPTEEAFRLLDRNGDGRISAEELAEGRRIARLILGAGPGGPPAGPGGPPPRIGPDEGGGVRIVTRRVERSAD